MKKQTVSLWLKSVTIRAARVHFLYIGAYIVSIIIFDSWNLIPHPDVAQRWTLAGILLIFNTVLWYVARSGVLKKNSHYKALLVALITADVAFAGSNVYTDRGMASKFVFLFVVPILTAALLKSRSALFATASLATATYSIAAVRYFHLHYGEGYRVQLYGEVALYSALFFVLAWLLLIIVAPKESS